MLVQLEGPDKVAEITGRRGMLVRASGGKGVTYQARNTWVRTCLYIILSCVFGLQIDVFYIHYSLLRKDVTMEMVNMHEKQLFMDGKKLVAIISEAGSAGVSLQADRRVVNQVIIFGVFVLVVFVVVPFGSWFVASTSFSHWFKLDPFVLRTEKKSAFNSRTTLERW